LLVLYFHWTRKVSIDAFQYHDHNHSFQIDYRNLKEMSDNFDLPQKRSHNLLENISKLEEEDPLQVQDWNNGEDVKFTEVDAIDIINQNQ